MGSHRVRHDWRDLAAAAAACLAIVNSAAMNIGVHVSFWIMAYAAQYQKNKQPNQKVGRRPKQTHHPNVHFSTIYNSQEWRHPRCPSTDGWIKKLWYTYTMEYYSVIKRNAFESVLMRWMNLETIVQSEVSQKEKDKCRKPAWGIPPVTRSCSRDLMGKASQISGCPPGISQACAPKTKTLPAFLLCFFTFLTLSGKSQIRALVFCIWKGCFS